MSAPVPGRSLGQGVSNALQCVRERRLPWALRWLKYIQLTRPILSARLILADLTRNPDLPSLLLHTFGARLVAQTLDSCRTLEMSPFLAFGTLLGHHREGGFITHDADVDFGILEADFSKVDALCGVMKKNGYAIRLRNEREVSFYKPYFPSLLVDFFLFHRKQDQVVYHDTRGETLYEYVFPATVFEQLRPVQFLGRIDALVPQGVEEFLEACYGDWRTPKKDFNNVHDHPNLTVLSPASASNYARRSSAAETR
jgi:hypothetical protein